MINLIPPEGHKALKREYVLRVGATLSLLFASVALMLAVALIPTYVLIAAQLNAFALESAQETKKVDALKEINTEVDMTKELLAQLKTTPEKVLVSAIIEEIQKHAPASVVFDTFYIESGADGVERIQVQGNAATREALARLKNELESSPMFEKAEVPIADLARDVDVSFAITITLSPIK